MLSLLQLVRLHILRFLPLPVLVAAAAEPVPAAAAYQGSPGEDRAAMQRAIDAAIDRGVQYLVDTQLLDGSWAPYAARYESGQTALALYALVKSGLPRDHPSALRALELVRAHPPHRTYSLACALMALAALADPQHEEWLGELAAELLGGQTAMGWAYPEGTADLSNTQYAALGLLAARRAGVLVPDQVWIDLVDQTLDFQARSVALAVDGAAAGRQPEAAGFAYRDDDSRPTGSMTAAGVSNLLISAWALGADAPAHVRERIARAQELGLAWLAQNFSVRDNPGGSREWLDYYLYGLERVGALAGIDRIGDHEWYWEGARELLKRQEQDGRWKDETDTCFALLFLSKATASTSGPRAVERGVYIAEDEPFDVRWRATGENPLTAWITGFGAAALEDLSHPAGRAPGLRVMRVDYLVEGEVAASVAGDPHAAWKGERFPIRHTFPERGSYAMQVRVLAVDPDGAEGAPAGIELWSDIVRVEVGAGFQGWMRDYAWHGAQNRALDVPVDAHASSEKPGHPARNAADGLHASTWIADRLDPEPALVLEFRHPVRANTLLLSHVNRNEQERGANDRATQVLLFVNRTTNPYALALAEDDLRKTEFRLPRTTSVRRLELRIVGRVAGTKHPGDVGFGEIELLLESRSDGEAQPR